MHDFESFAGTPFEGVTPVDDTTRLLEVVELDFVDQQTAVLDQLEALGLIAGSPYSYHNTYLVGQTLNVFVRPIPERADIVRVTSNTFLVNPDTCQTHREIDDFILSLRTGFITERNTAFEYTTGKSFNIPEDVGPVMWISAETILLTRSGSKYKLPIPVGLFGGWGDEDERIAMLTKRELHPEKIIKGRLNNIERHRRLIALLGRLGEHSLKHGTIIEEK